MKKCIIISLVLFLFSSCGLLKDRSVDKSKETIVYRDMSYKSEKAPGDNVTVYLPYPLSNPKRPKFIDTTYTGKNGAKLDVSFDSLGVINRLEADCPEIDKIEQNNIEFDQSIKTKETESKANIDLAREIGRWTFYSVCVISFFGCVAVLGRTLILQK